MYTMYTSKCIKVTGNKANFFIERRGKNVKKLTQEELNVILDNHEKWVKSNRDIHKDDLLRWISVGTTEGERAKLYDYDLSGLDFSGRNLILATFASCHLDKTDFSKSYLLFVDFGESQINQATFEESSLDYASLNYVKAVGTNFDKANLRRIKGRQSIFNESTFRETYLSNSDFYGTQFKLTDFTRAVFDGAYIVYSDFTHACLEGTNLEKNNTRTCRF